MPADDDDLAWTGSAPPTPRPGGPVAEVGINGRADLAIDPDASPSTPSERPAGRAGTVLQVERLGPAPDPAQPRPSGRVKLTRQ
jgi:hypothetical protein